MPRRSAASAAFPTSAPARLRPPAGLPGPERELFVNLVVSCRADHFQASDLPILTAYVRACVLEETAAAELAAAGFVVDDGKKVSPWLDVLKTATRNVSVLSRLLRLNPVARQASRAEPEIASFYERMALEDQRDDDPTAN